MDNGGPVEQSDDSRNDLTETLAKVDDFPAHPARPSVVLAGRYRIRRMVGKGGMGEVYEAEDTELGGLVALKTVRPDLSSHPSFVARFLREVQLARRVTHANICRVFDVAHDDSSGTSRVFLTMEFLVGETLSARLRRQGKFSPEDAAPLVAQMAAGLAALHEHAIIHRDLKPGNVMLAKSPNGRMRAVITDFGLSRTVEDSHDSGVSTTGFAGTPDYMSPEQLCGRELTPASDVYPLGLMMFEMITGRRAFAGGHAIQNAVQRVTTDVESPAKFVPGLDPAWELLILRCLAKEPQDRPSAAEVALSLKGNSPSGPSTIPTAPPPHRRRFSPWILAPFVVAALALAVWMNFRNPAPAPTADPVITRITTDTGLSFDPAISRDGKMVAFSSDRAGGGDLDLWVQQIGGGSPMRLTQSGADEASPDFSPDGTKIVFRSERNGGGIYGVSTMGGEPTLIVSEGRNPKFSPDGRFIAYWTGMDGAGFGEGSARVSVIPAGGGESRIIAPAFAVTQYPVWSPAGDALICLGRRDSVGPLDNSLDLYVLPLDSRAPQKTGARALFASSKLLSPTTQISWIPLAWLDSPSRVVFAAATGDATNLFSVGIDDGFTIRETPKRLTSGSSHEAQASFGGGTSKMVYSSLRLNFDIWGLPLDSGSAQPQGPLRRLSQSESSEAFPSLSWDGTLLAFRSRVSSNISLMALNLKTGKLATLLSGPSSVREPRISGDGATVTFRDASNSIVQIPIQGGSAKALCHDCGEPIDAGRDSRYILVEPHKGPDDVLMLDALTGKISSIVRERQVLLGARWSPDGNWVAFQEVRRNTNRTGIYVVRAGQEPVLPERWIAVTDGTNTDRSPAWSPSGNMLYFLSDRDGFRCLYAQRLDPLTKQPRGAPVVVQHIHQPGLSLKFLVNRDAAIGLGVGRDLAAFSLGELTGNIWLKE